MSRLYQGKVWIVSSWTGGYPQEQNSDVILVYDPITDILGIAVLPLLQQLLLPTVHSRRLDWHRNDIEVRLPLRCIKVKYGW